MLEFETGSGRLCLDLVRTLRFRGSAQPTETLTDPAALSAWVAQFSGRAAPVPHPLNAQVRYAQRLRDAVAELIAARQDDREPAAEARERVNAAAAHATAAPALADGSVTRAVDHVTDATLAAVARDAIDLVSSPLVDRVKECDNPACKALFLDGSRPGTRRWCSMDSCGDQAKKTAQRERSRRGQPLREVEGHRAPRTRLRACQDGDRPAILALVNDAAQAYRGVIPDDRWHDPYMSADELDSEIAAGVAFTGFEVDGVLLGVMGVQPVLDVDLVRHAYVSPAAQGRGVGGVLLRHLLEGRTRPVLVGTWAAADWAVRFYVAHGFVLEPADHKADLLRTYWNIPERQVETSVVLARWV